MMSPLAAVVAAHMLNDCYTSSLVLAQQLTVQQQRSWSTLIIMSRYWPAETAMVV
jgi:hypothetical protein